MNKDYIKHIEGAERRFITPEIQMEERGEDDNKTRHIQGYAAVFNTRTSIGGYWEEEIMPGAFDDIDNDDVRALFNHNPNYILARSGSGTLTLRVDEKGLFYSFPVSGRSFSQDLADAVASGDVAESSFAFTVREEKWIERDGDIPLRQIFKMKRTYDVSPVTFPAYQDTTVGMRSMTAAIGEPGQPDKNNERKSFRDAQLIINQNRTQ